MTRAGRGSSPCWGSFSRAFPPPHWCRRPLTAIIVIFHARFAGLRADLPCSCRHSLCCTLALLFIRIGDARTYAAQVKSGKWHYGAIVFPGGDIVVRDVLPCGRTELHVERMHLQRAVVRPGRSWRTMFLLEPHVVIRRTELTGETREFAFPASAFADSAQLIVACMNAGAHGSGDRGRAGNGGNGGGREGGDRRGGESGDVA